MHGRALGGDTEAARGTEYGRPSAAGAVLFQPAEGRVGSTLRVSTRIGATRSRMSQESTRPFFDLQMQPCSTMITRFRPGRGAYRRLDTVRPWSIRNAIELSAMTVCLRPRVYLPDGLNCSLLVGPWSSDPTSREQFVPSQKTSATFRSCRPKLCSAERVQGGDERDRGDAELEQFTDLARLRSSSDSVLSDAVSKDPMKTPQYIVD